MQVNVGKKWKCPGELYLLITRHTNPSWVFQPCVRGAQGGEVSLHTTLNCNSSHQTAKLCWGSAAMAWHTIHTVTPRLLWRSEAISSVDSPQRGGAGHLTTANRLSQSWWNENEANCLDPHQSKRRFFLFFLLLMYCCLCFLLLCVPFIFIWTVQRAHKTSVNNLYAFLIMPWCVQTAQKGWGINKNAQGTKLNPEMGKRKYMCLVYGLHKWKEIGQDMNLLYLVPGIGVGVGKGCWIIPQFYLLSPFPYKNCQDYFTAGRSGQKWPKRLILGFPHWGTGVIHV